MQATMSFVDKRDRAISETLDSNHELKRLVALEQGQKPMARVPEVACGKICLARGIHCCPNIFFYIFCPPSVPVLCKICVCVCVCVCIHIWAR